MITDQKQTGVPNAQGIKARTQLVNPHNSVSNPGAKPAQNQQLTSSSSNTKTAPSSQQIDSQKQVQALASQLLSNAQQKTQNQIGSIGAPNAAQSGAQISSASNAAAPQIQSNAVVSSRNYNDEARNAIRQMNDNEIDSLLNDISSGKLKGNNVDGIFNANQPTT